MCELTVWLKKNVLERKSKLDFMSKKKIKWKFKWKFKSIGSYISMVHQIEFLFIFFVL